MHNSFVTPFRLSFGVICWVIALQMILGEWFYKSRIGPVYLSELFILIAVLIVMPALLMRLKIPRVTPVYLFILLSLVYFFYSLFQEREYRWIFRHAALFLYSTVAIMSYDYVKRNYAIINWDRFFNMLGIIGGILVAFHGYTHLVPGHAWYPATLLFLVGYSFWIVRAEGVLKKIILALGCAIFVARFIGNTSLIITPVVVLWFCLFIYYKRLRLFLVFTGVVGVVLSFILVEGLRDGNAVWRYMYWMAIIQDSWESSWCLLGKGFGLQVVPDKYLWIIECQVKENKDLAYQLMTVPPHNSLITILRYLGGIGVLVFCYPLIKGFRRAVSGELSFPAQVLLIGSLGLFCILGANQFLEFPYAAVTFWMIYGALWACLQQSERQREVVARYVPEKPGKR